MLSNHALWTAVLCALLMAGSSRSIPASASRSTPETTQVVGQAAGIWEDISDRLPVQPTGVRPITSVVVRANLVWAAEHNTGILYRSDDYGATFSAIPTGLTSIFDVTFFDELNGVMISNSKFTRTSDGGLTWSAPVTVGPTIYAASFATPLIGYAGGNAGTVYRTTDGGLTWTVIAPNYFVASILDIAFPDPATPNTGYLVIANAGSTLYKTTDGGVSWNVVTLEGIQSGMDALDFVSPESAWAVGGFGNVFRLKDGLWNKQVSNAPLNEFGEQVNLNAVSFLPDGLTGWVVGNHAAILHTTDGGQTWAQAGQSLSLPGQTWLTGIAAVSPTLAFASGYPASVMGGPATDDRRLFLYHAPEYNHHLYVPLLSH